MTEDEVFRRLDVAEKAIQAVMLALDRDLEGSGWAIAHVDVDTRNFGNMKVEISAAGRHD